MSESGCPGFKDLQDEDWEQLKNTNSFELILLMQSGQLASTLSITIYKAPQKGKCSTNFHESLNHGEYYG